MLTEQQRRAAAARLWTAEADRAPVTPLVRDWPAVTAADAYGIQLINIRRRCGAGARITGHKVGLSSPVMQRMMSVDEPDYGHLLDDMELTGTVAAARYCAPRVEVEVGFVLGADLPGEGCTPADVLAATERVVPALELIDSRIADWDIGIADTIADNASGAGYAVGEGRDPRGLDLRAIDARLTTGSGELLAEGRSDAVLGDPAASVAWLARTVARFGVPLEKGHLVLPGSCTRAVDVRPGHTYRADFRGLGHVSLTFE
ncbi:2-keto-4-pentenoate hydratase [Streptomyces sp. SID14478]|uniref:2-keto-4-pentenoate hydratase n=1 Tax=Streptomyces sp. SID14478 TaxID=2706073 RepID=UPI0013DEBEA9|nr:2-keto-4-pentenoate hydratase [Streptomyces sp. SID14478]NEB81523.1 2-keto-4-pentenoate hydratase [Streptomyces sp. SID14478]